MAELIDVPTCNPFATADCRGSSGPSEPSFLHLIKEDLDCVRQRDPAARSKLETLLTYPGVHAVIWHRIAHRWGGGWRFLARFLSWLGRFLTNVAIHPGATIGRRLRHEGFNEYNREDAMGPLVGKQCTARGSCDDM